MSDIVDFFVQIPKTAGTTMLQIIEGRHLPDNVLSFQQIPPPGGKRSGRNSPVRRGTFRAYRHFLRSRRPGQSK